MMTNSKQKTRTAPVKPLRLDGRTGKEVRRSFGLDPAQLQIGESPEVEAMGARAVARGNVISFAPGEFAPGTAEGRAVLGHELEYVRGQAAGEVPMTGGVLEEPSFEAAADRAGAAFASGSLTSAGPVDAGALAGHSAPAQMKKKSYVDQIRDIQIPQARARKAGEKWRGYSPENAKGIFEGGTRASANPIMKEAGLPEAMAPFRGVFLASEELKLTDEELQKYYEENKNSFDVANYEMITFKGAAASTKDADGNTVQPTEEESAAALQKAKDAAAAVLETVKSGILPEKAAKEYESIATYSHPESGTYSGDAATKWVFDDSRQAGDTELVENGTSIYLLIFHSRGRNDYNTVDVRHILFKVDTSSLDSKADDYQAKLEELKAGKKQEAENALQAWKAGDATEESFAALANKLSEDPGSNTNGGLYKQVYKGQMVSEFNDWCFDESRKAGDTGIVANDAAGGSYIGYHVMYFVGTDDPYWMVQVRNAMMNKDYSEWSANLVKDITATENSGMKYVG